MKSYTCSWEELPAVLKTKTFLIRLGFDPNDFGPVVAEVIHYGKKYPLYNLDNAIQNALKAGHKTAINAKNKDTILIMDINVTGWDSKDDEVIELMLMSLDGLVVFHQWFKPSVSISEKNKRFLKNPTLDKAKPIAEYWEEIQDYICGKLLIIPNKFHVWEMMAQTCAKYDLHLQVETLYMEGHERIQKYFVSRTALPEAKSDALLTKNCINMIRYIYANSELFPMQEKAKYYFNLLCNHRIRQGDLNSFSTGYSWIFRTFGEKTKDFENYSWDTCLQIIAGLEPTLKSLKLI